MMKFYWRHTAAWIGFTVLTVNFAFADDAAFPQRFADLGACETMSGTSIADCRIGYRTAGTLNEDRSNAVLVPTWFTGISEGLLFLANPEAIDPSTYFIIFADAIGNGVSISPSNSASQPLEKFPQLRIVDMVDAQKRLLTEQFGIEKLHAVVGISMGGMQAFEWGVRYPDFVKRIVSIVGSPQLPVFDIVLWRTLNQLRKMLRDCQCDEPLEIMSLVEMMTDSPEGLSQKLSREVALGTLPASKPLDPADSWNGERQAEAMIYHDIARDLGGDLAAAAQAVKADVLVVVSLNDRVVTPHPALKFAELDGADSVILDSGCGHGPFRCEPQIINTSLKAFLADD
jgi:homoserine O-acetyltransferase